MHRRPDTEQGGPYRAIRNYDRAVQVVDVKLCRLAVSTLFLGPVLSFDSDDDEKGSVLGLIDWFRRLAEPANSGNSAAPQVSEGEDKGAEVGGLNFKSAVDAHMKWKVRLESYINGTSEEDLKVETVSCDDRCPLGKWIYDQGGERFGYSETFFEMKVHHANFHRCAGGVLAAAQAGDTDKARRLLQHGDYVRASERVKQLLARLFVLVADGRAAIDAHVKWKERLHDAIAGGNQEELSIDMVCRDDQCTLGQWLNGVGGERFGTLPAFRDVLAKHVYFHQCAGKVLGLAKAGRKEEAISMLEEGDYAIASSDVTTALVGLFSAQVV
jgi:hypothetical protein